MANLVLAKSEEYFVESFKEDLKKVGVYRTNYSAGNTIGSTDIGMQSVDGIGILMDLSFTSDNTKVKINNNVGDGNALMIGVVPTVDVKTVAFGIISGSDFKVNADFKKTDTAQGYDRAYIISGLEINFQGV